MEVELKQFKEQIIKGVDLHIDRLLELRTFVKNADSFDSIVKGLKNEKKRLAEDFPEK